MIKKNKIDFLKHFDIFGIPYLFTFNEENKFKTKLGGMFTIISALIIISILYFIGEEIISRNNPRDLVTIEKSSIPPNITFSINSAFLYVDEKSSFIENYEKYIRFEGYYNYYVNDDNGIFNSVIGYPINLSIRKCKSLDFPKETLHQYNIMSLDEALCIDNPKQELGGDFSGNYAKYLSIFIKPCKNDTQPKVVCASEDEITEYLSYGLRSISMHHDSIIYNPKNFSSPIKKFITEDNYKFDIMFCKEISYFIQEMNIITDQGIFWKDLIPLKDQMVDKVKIESYRNDYNNLKFSDLCLFEFRYFSSVNMTLHYRDYIKGVDIIAQMGGILKIYLLLGEIIFFYVYKRRMSEFVITKLYHISEEDLKSECNINYRNNINEVINKNILKHEKNVMVESNNDKKVENYVEIVSINKHDINNKCNKNISSMIRLNVQTNFNQINKKKKNRITNFFTNYEYIYITFCSCFLSKSIKDKLSKFNLFKIISSQYTDIIKIIKKLNEITKLKFVLLNKKQLAIFNLIDSPYSPLDSHKIPKYSEKNKYELNEELQITKAEEFLSTPIPSLFKKKIDRRLYKFLCN